MKKERAVNRHVYVCVCVVCVYVQWPYIFAWCQGRALTRVKIDVRPYQPEGLFPEPVVISRIGNRHVSGPLPLSNSPFIQGSGNFVRNDRRYPRLILRNENVKTNIQVSMCNVKLCGEANKNFP